MAARSAQSNQSWHRRWRSVALVEDASLSGRLMQQCPLVLRSNFELPSGRSFDPRSGPLSRAYLDGVWGFHLRPAPGGRTRLVARTRGRSRPQPFMGAFSLLLGEPLHFIMQTRQFYNLRTRVAAEV